MTSRDSTARRARYLARKLGMNVMKRGDAWRLGSGDPTTLAEVLADLERLNAELDHAEQEAWVRRVRAEQEAWLRRVHVTSMLADHRGGYDNVSAKVVDRTLRKIERRIGRRSAVEWGDDGAPIICETWEQAWAHVAWVDRWRLGNRQVLQTIDPPARLAGEDEEAWRSRWYREFAASWQLLMADAIMVYQSMLTERPDNELVRQNLHELLNPRAPWTYEDDSDDDDEELEARAAEIVETWTSEDEKDDPVWWLREDEEDGRER